MEYYKFCTLRASNASWFLDFKWLVVIAGVPRWAYWSRPANEPTTYPWNQTARKITISRVGNHSTTNVITTNGTPSHRSGASRTTTTSTAYTTAAPNALPTAPITAPETSTVAAAAATSKSSAAQRVMVLDLWTSLLFWFGPLLIVMVTVGGMVWL